MVSISSIGLGSGVLLATTLFATNCWYAWSSAMSGARQPRGHFIVVLCFGIQGALVRKGGELLARSDHGRTILAALCFASAIAGFLLLTYFQRHAATASDTALVAILVWLTIVASFFCGAVLARRSSRGRS